MAKTPDAPETPTTPNGTMISAADIAAIRENTAALLAKQPKKKVRLRADPNPKAPNFETVQINGYTYMIKKGEEVEVPEEVHEILVRSGLY